MSARKSAGGFAENSANTDAKIFSSAARIWRGFPGGIARKSGETWRVILLVAAATPRLVWGAARLPIFSLLLIFEPIVRLVLTWMTLLAVLTAFLFEFSGAAPGFPFWGMITFSVGCALTLTGYYALLSLLSR